MEKTKDVIKKALNVVVDEDTGEIEERSGVFITADEYAKRKKYTAERKNDIEVKLESLTRENENLKLILSAGAEEDGLSFKCKNFVWLHIKNKRDPFSGLKASDIAKLVFLATYLRYQPRGKTGTLLSIVKPRLKEILRLGNATYYGWINKIIERGYLKFTGADVFTDINLFSNGKLPKVYNTRSVRLFVKVVRELYNAVPTKEHHKIGMVFQLIPYTNTYFNCLAKNLSENDIDNLLPLTLDDLGEKLGYSTRQMSRIRADLFGLRFGLEHKRVAVPLFLGRQHPCKCPVMFNPELFFGGAPEDYQAAMDLFSSMCREADRIDV